LFSARRRVSFPLFSCDIAPTVKAMKLAVIAATTFVSTDDFMRSPFRDFPFSDRNHRVILSFLFLVVSDSSPGVDGATTQPGALL
jgi:hypothetical protein